MASIKKSITVERELFEEEQRLAELMADDIAQRGEIDTDLQRTAERELSQFDRTRP